MKIPKRRVDGVVQRYSKSKVLILEVGAHGVSLVNSAEFSSIDKRSSSPINIPFDFVNRKASNRKVRLKAIIQEYKNAYNVHKVKLIFTPKFVKKLVIINPNQYKMISYGQAHDAYIAYMVMFHKTHPKTETFKNFNDWLLTEVLL